MTAVAYAERGPYIATGGDDANVRLWRAGDLSLVRTYRSHREAISALAFSPDGRYLAAAAVDGRIRVWSTSSSSLYRLNAQNKGRVQGLVFSPAGDMLASAADDGTVQLWHLRQSRAVRSTSKAAHPPAPSPSPQTAAAPPSPATTAKSASGTLLRPFGPLADAGGPGIVGPRSAEGAHLDPTSASYSSFSPIDLTIGANRPRSSTMNLIRCSAELSDGTAPCLRIASR